MVQIKIPSIVYIETSSLNRLSLKSLKKYKASVLAISELKIKWNLRSSLLILPKSYLLIMLSDVNTAFIGEMCVPSKLLQMDIQRSEYSSIVSSFLRLYEKEAVANLSF